MLFYFGCKRKHGASDVFKLLRVMQQIVLDRFIDNIQSDEFQGTAKELYLLSQMVELLD